MPCLPGRCDARHAPIPDSEGGTNHDATGGIKGINGNCDDAQQAQICHYGGGVYGRDRSIGCMICQRQGAVRGFAPAPRSMVEDKI